MPAATDLYTTTFQPPAPPVAPSDSGTDGGTMPALYRAALGPVHTDRYLALFDRFDTRGRAATGWNWAASLCTINWMVFRQLWSAALVYLAAAEGLGLLVFGLGRQFLQWPTGVEWGVLGALALLAFAVPGLYGDAVLYADVRRRIDRALAASRTVPEACALLAQRASSRKRLRALVLVNAVLAVAVALACLALPRADSHWQGTALAPAVTVAEAASAAASPAAPASEPAAAPASQPEVAVAAPPPPEPQTAPTPAPEPAPAAQPAPAAPSSAVPAPVGSAPGYYINVGLFAEETNARKAQARLLNEGLPAFRQATLNADKARRIRVRVGPYASRAQADAAAASIRAMALEAVVFQQR
ncbi:MAG: SPOR domain-containing protein [Acidovorax sp.]|uniref:SPOR domain-containing protein n=1 Tax=Acidovorax sp. TaxID=1872122 RepID=UPI0039E2CBF5